MSKNKKDQTRDMLTVKLPTSNKKLELYLHFPTDEATPRHYICGNPEAVKKYLTSRGYLV